jgi:hypothetical protein
MTERYTPLILISSSQKGRRSVMPYPASMGSMSKLGTYFDGQYLSGYLQPSSLSPSLGKPQQPDPGASIAGPIGFGTGIFHRAVETEGGTLSLNIAVWQDDSREAACLRAEGVGLMLALPTSCLVEAVESLQDLAETCFHASPLQLVAAPPERLTAPSGPLQPRRSLQIQG